MRKVFIAVDMQKENTIIDVKDAIIDAKDAIRPLAEFLVHNGWIKYTTNAVCSQFRKESSKTDRYYIRFNDVIIWCFPQEEETKKRKKQNRITLTNGPKPRPNSKGE